MSNSEQVRARIGSLDERVARLRAEKSRLLARANQTERKRDTRRKILIGGAVLAAIEHEGVPVLRSSSELLRCSMRFDCWKSAIPPQNVETLWRRRHADPQVVSLE